MVVCSKKGVRAFGVSASGSETDENDSEDEQSNYNCSRDGVHLNAGQSVNCRPLLPLLPLLLRWQC